MDKELFDILTIDSRNDYELFCNYVVKNEVNLDLLIFSLLKHDAIIDEYEALLKLAWFFNTELHMIYIGGDFHFKVSSFAESFKKYLYSWKRLGTKKVPFEKWSDLAEEGINLLKTLIDEKKLEKFKEDARYRDFMKRFIKRHEDLRLSGEYPDLNELMDD
ncbi:MAG TPA: hypothetical protein PLJ21_12455 [Pseudobdellovibrionaceae bacterium]|nr:hypothetical protein [Pseudobdellovibrionaceae bacterium]